MVILMVIMKVRVIIMMLIIMRSGHAQVEIVRCVLSHLFFATSLKGAYCHNKYGTENHHRTSLLKFLGSHKNLMATKPILRAVV